MLDFMYMGFTELRGSSGNRSRNLSHHKLTISLDHLVTLSDDEICLTRAPRGTDRSPEYNEYFCYKLDSRVKNLTKEWNEKQQHFITHASRSLLWIQFVAVAFRSEEENFWSGPPWPILPRLDPPLGRYGQIISMHVPGHEHFIPTKIRKHPLSGYVVKADYVFPYIYMH